MTPRESVPDEQLAIAAQSGEHSAFETLVRRHKARIYRFVRRYVGQSDDAYDILQDCFVAAWSGLNRYDPKRPFLPWLRIIALNKCRDFSRRQKVRRLMLRAFALERGSEQMVRIVHATDDEQTDLERLHRLDQAIAGLPAFYKEPLLLTTVGGLSNIEAAETLKTTPKAIEMRLYRARQKLNSTLAG